MEQLPTPEPGNPTLTPTPKPCCELWELARPVRLGVGSCRWLVRLGVGVDRREAAVGSNNWEIAGRLTTDGGALLANDMHSCARAKHWYRAVLEWPNPSNASTPHRLSASRFQRAVLVVGATRTSPGVHHSQADWNDLVILDVDPRIRIAIGRRAAGAPSRIR